MEGKERTKLIPFSLTHEGRLSSTSQVHQSIWKVGVNNIDKVPRDDIFFFFFIHSMVRFLFFLVPERRTLVIRLHCCVVYCSPFFTITAKSLCIRNWSRTERISSCLPRTYWQSLSLLPVTSITDCRRHHVQLPHYSIQWKRRLHHSPLCRMGDVDDW